MRTRQVVANSTFRFRRADFHPRLIHIKGVLPVVA
jgi:hypothetical protein